VQWYEDSTFLVELAGTAAGDASNQHPVAHFEVLHFLADLLNYANTLMPEGSSVCAPWHISLENVKIRSADGGSLHLHQSVETAAELGNLFIDELEFADSIVNERLHVGLRCCG
jgi:hypothetical protein